MWQQVGEEVLGTAAKIEVTKENCTIVGDGSSEEAVKSRVKQIKNIVANTEQDYEKEKLNERIARLSGGVAIIQVHLIPHLPTPHPSSYPVCMPAASASLLCGSNAWLDMQCGAQSWTCSLVCRGSSCSMATLFVCYKLKKSSALQG